MPGNTTTGLYGTISANVTIPVNNNTGLYNATGNGTPLSGNTTLTNLSVLGNINVGGYISAVGNITGAYFQGNGYYLTGLPIQYSNANVAAYLPTYTGNIGAGNVNATGNISGANLNLTGGITDTSGTLVISSIGTIYIAPGTGTPGQLGNTTIIGNVTALNGNVTAPYFIGNGSQLTGVTNYGNANVAAYLPIYGGNILANVVGANLLTTAGNTGNITGVNFVTANYFVGDGSYLTNVSGTGGSNYSNANVTAFLPTYSGNIGALNINGNTQVTGNLSVTGNVIITNTEIVNQTITVVGNVTAGNIFTANVVSAAGNIAGGNINTAGIISATGNLRGGNVNTVGLVTATGNITGGNLITAGFVTATGNITGNYIIGNGSQLTGLPASYSNANVAAYLPTYSGNLGAGNISVAGNITATANITGAYFIGNGSQLTGVPGNYSNANVAAYLPNYSGDFGGIGNLTAIGNIAGGNISSLGIVSVAGDITAGNVSTVGTVTAGNISTSNLTIGGTLGVQTLSVAGNIIGVGGISILGNVVAPNITATFNGTFSYLTVNNSANLNNISLTGAVNLANTLSGTFAIQQNANARTGLRIIASANNASALAASATLYSTSNVSNAAALALQVYTSEVRLITSGIGNVTTVPLNIYTGANLAATFDVNRNLTANANITAVGNVTATYFLGNGSQLSGLPATYSNANVASYLTTYTGNLTANVISTTGNIYTSANISTAGAVNGSTLGAAGLIQGGSINTPGNITGGNVSTAGQVIAANVTTGGNVSAGNISFTGLVQGANASFTNYVNNLNMGNNYIFAPGVPSGILAGLPIICAVGGVQGGNLITPGYVTATGNVIGNYFVGNGSLLTGITTNYSNANVTAFLPTYSGNIGNLTVNGNLSVTGNVTITNTEIVNQTITTVGNITGGNLLTGGQISSTGNITGNYFIGNGSALTGMYSNTTVTNYLSGGTYSGDINAPSGVVTAAAVNSTGAVTASSYVQAAGGIYSISTYGGTYSDGIVVDYVTGQGRISIGAGDGFAIFNSGVGGVNLVTVSSTGNVSVLGNVSAPYFIGNGSQLTGLAATYSNANVAAYLPTYSGDLGAVVNITASGNVTALLISATGNVDSGGNVLADGYMSATGNITGGNVLTGGLITTTGNITGNNIIVINNATVTGNILAGTGISSFGNIQSNGNILMNGATANLNLSTNGNLHFTSNTLTTTRLRIMASANTTATGNNATAAMSLYTTANTANTAILSFQISATESRIQTSAAGSVASLPLVIYSNATPALTIDTATNITAAANVTVTGNVYAANITGPNAATSVALVNYKDTASVLTYASTITPNIALGSIQTVTLTGNVTFSAYGGTPQAGQSLTLIVLQDSTGNRLLTSTMKFAGGAKTLSTAANAADIIYSFYDGTNYYATLSRAYQ